MLSSDEWKQAVVTEGIVRCPVCRSNRVTMDACAVGAFTVHQEYVCETCQYEFTPCSRS